MKHYVYTDAQKRSFRRTIWREIRKIKFADLIERGLCDIGGESGL